MISIFCLRDFDKVEILRRTGTNVSSLYAIWLDFDLG
jgi:hypothetical protein